MSSTMSQVIAPSMEPETLEMSILRLPECINSETAPEIMADLDRLLQPHGGLMLDFSQTVMLDPDAAHIVNLAHRLATERQATIGTMGENEQIQAVLQFSEFFDRVQKSL